MADSITGNPDMPAEADLLKPDAEVSATPETRQEADMQEKPWQQWYLALKESFPTYSAIHIAFFITTVYASLFIIQDFSGKSLPIATLWNSWHHWDTGHYMAIARLGYNFNWRTAFFPLYPILIRLVMFIFPNPLIAALLISDVLGLGVLILLYRLIKEDFNVELARRTILYLSVFPTAFFLAAGYTESTFLFLVVLMFYSMRNGRWWLAGSAGLLASLTRSSGLFLILPFCYEYLAQHEFTLKNIKRPELRVDMLAGLLIPLGTGLFALYCYWTFNDPLMFSHVEVYWGRTVSLPWHGIISSINNIRHSGGILNFLTLRTMIDLGADLLALAAIILMVIGPWRLPRKYWSYVLYAGVTYLFFMLLPTSDKVGYPLQSTSRYVLALFPVFIILARMGGNRLFHLCYLAVSGALLFFLLTQFLTGHWVL